MARRWVLLLALGLAASPSVADAAGLVLPVRGVRAFAMAGAFVAGADDPSAMWYNPANLADLRGTRLMVDFGLIAASSTFARTGFDPVSSDAAPLFDPSVFVTSDFGLKNTTFAFGLFAPYAGSFRYPLEGPQRYSLISNVGTLAIYVGAAAAWQPHKKFRVGLAFETAIVNARFAKAASGQHILGENEDIQWDLLAQVKMTSLFNPTIGFGLWFNPVGGLELAVSLQTPVSVNGEGTLRLRPLTDDPNPSFDPTEQRGDRASLSFELPLVVRAAVRYRHGDSWDLEAAMSFERWSALKSLTLSPKDVYLINYPGLDAYRIKDQVFIKNFRNTVALSLGGSVRLHRMVRLRGGYFFEPSAVPDATASVETLDADKHAFGLGATLTFGKWAIDLMYSHVFLVERIIVNSEARQINPIDAGRTTVVGNGIYQGGYDIFGAAVNYRF